MKKRKGLAVITVSVEEQRQSKWCNATLAYVGSTWTALE